MKTLTLGLAVGTAILAGGQMVQAAPSTTNITNLWLFDDAPGGVAADSVGNVDLNPVLTNRRIEPGVNVPFISPGTPIDISPISAGNTTTNYAATPFSYAGNQSVLIDFDKSAITGQEQYPRDRVGLGTHSGNIAIGSEGAVSFWYNPVFHNQGNGAFPGDDSGAESYLFYFRGSGSTRLDIRTYRYNDGRDTYGFVDNGSYSGDLSISDFGFDYTGLDDGAPSDTWYNVVLTWGANGLSLYVDGVLLGHEAGFVMNEFVATDVFIGTHNAYHAQSPGLYDEFAVWNVELSEDDVLWLNENSLGAPATTPVPEPTTAGLLAMGLAGLAMRRSKRHA